MGILEFVPGLKRPIVWHALQINPVKLKPDTYQIVSAHGNYSDPPQLEHGNWKWMSINGLVWLKQVVTRPYMTTYSVAILAITDLVRLHNSNFNIYTERALSVFSHPGTHVLYRGVHAPTGVLVYLRDSFFSLIFGLCSGPCRFLLPFCNSPWYGYNCLS